MMRLTGAEAEERAVELLKDRGYRVVARNWRCRFGEIDIVARRGDPRLRRGEGTVGGRFRRSRRSSRCPEARSSGDGGGAVPPGDRVRASGSGQRTQGPPFSVDAPHRRGAAHDRSPRNGGLREDAEGVAGAATAICGVERKAPSESEGQRLRASTSAQSRLSERWALSLR